MNSLFPKDMRLIRLPAKEELIIFLISEDIRNRKIIKHLEKEGQDGAYAGDLSKLILGLVGFEDRSDQLYALYFRQLDENALDLNLSENRELHERAFKIYKNLMKLL
jgi:hypothetical protein